MVEKKETGAPTEVAHPENKAHTTSQAAGGLAIASMVVGIIAFLLGWVPFFGLFAGVTAVVLGIIGLKKLQNKGLAITGVVTGGLAVLSGLWVTIAVIFTLGGLSMFVNEFSDALEEGTTSVQEKVDAKKDFAKGEVGVFGDREVKIISVQRNFVPENEYIRPAEGKEFIVVEVEVKNAGELADSISPYDFSIEEAGLAQPPHYQEVSGALDDGALQPGATTAGKIVYEVSKDATDLTLTYVTYDYNFSAGRTETLNYSIAL